MCLRPLQFVRRRRGKAGLADRLPPKARIEKESKAKKNKERESFHSVASASGLAVPKKADSRLAGLGVPSGYGHALRRLPG